MLLALIVVVNGAFVPSSPPPRRLFGYVMAPLAPVIARLAERVTVTGDTVEVARGERRCVFRVGSRAFACNDRIATAPVAPFAQARVVFLPLATVAHALGGEATLDATASTVSVAMPPDVPLVTPSPFDSAAPRAKATLLFTPQPAPPTPRAIESGDPRPRRTAIPFMPSRVPES